MRKRPFGRHGIRQRIMLYLEIFVALIILLLWLFQIVLLDNFYRQYKIRQISSTADILLQNLSEDSDTLSDLASQLSEHNEICILLLDEQQNVLLSAEGTRNCLIHRLSSRGLAWWCEKADSTGTVKMELFHMQSVPVGPVGSLLTKQTPLPTIPDEETTFSQADFAQNRTRQANRNRWEGFESTEIQSMLYARRITLPSGESATLLLNSQINPVNSTVGALRAQMFAITVIVALGALLLAAMISRRVSTPLIETTKAAKALSRAQYVKPPHSDSYTEIYELNQTLEKAAAELGQVEKLQHELIANISHDLRTPLTMIGGYAEAMRDLPSENTPENMQIIIDETARLSTLVNELLDFSRMQAGSTQLHPTIFNLTQAVETMINRVGKLTAKDGYVIRFIHDAPVQVCADETRIGQVIYNLIGNALTYTGEDKLVTVTQTVSGTTAHIAISDTGKGIAKEEIDLIWNRYYRTKETHKRAVIGSGLGLNIVRTILDQHQTPYGVESEEGKGTTFWFELEVTQEGAEPSA